MSDPWSDQIRADVLSLPQPVTASSYAEKFGYSVPQARHILNRATEYGAIKKVRLDPPCNGVRFGYTATLPEVQP